MFGCSLHATAKHLGVSKRQACACIFLISYRLFKNRNLHSTVAIQIQTILYHIASVRLCSPAPNYYYSVLTGQLIYDADDVIHAPVSGAMLEQHPQAVGQLTEVYRARHMLQVGATTHQSP